MRQIFICEKCGAQFDSYDDAYKCENSHHMLAIGGDFRPETEESCVYGASSPIPTKVVLASEEFSTWDEKAEAWEYHTVFGEYKLVRMLPEKECEKFLSAKAEREEKSRREWEEYMARREAERKAKEAENEQTA